MRRPGSFGSPEDYARRKIAAALGKRESVDRRRRADIGGRTFEDFDRSREVEPDDTLDVSRGYILVDLENLSPS